MRADFPMLNKKIDGLPLCYLDSGATTLKPTPVIQAVSDYYGSYCSNVHRGAHSLSQQSTDEYEKARSIIQKWIKAPELDEVIFTSGTTGSFNLLSYSYGELLSPGDEVVVSVIEHHSNLVPWQLLEKRKKVVLKVIPVSDDGELDLDVLSQLLSSKTKMVSVSHVSNTLGTVNPVREIISLVRKKSQAVIAIDGAQAVAHFPLSMEDLDADFYCFSGHKVFGPTGIGVLFGRKKWLDLMPPFMGGGSMIETMDFSGTTFAPIPQKFEAGTPHIAGAIGLGRALEYLQSYEHAGIMAHEKELAVYGVEKLKEIPGLQLLGQAKDRVPIFTFVIDGVHPQDLAMILDKKGIAVRTGRHCTWPLLKRFGQTSSARASLAVYNTTKEIDQLVKGMKEALEILR